MGVRPESAKTGPILRISTGDFIFLPVSAVQPKFFRAKTRPENAVGMVGTEVDALFRAEGGLIFRDIRRSVKTNVLETGVAKKYRDKILGHGFQRADGPRSVDAVGW